MDSGWIVCWQYGMREVAALRRPSPREVNATEREQGRRLANVREAHFVQAPRLQAIRALRVRVAHSALAAFQRGQAISESDLDALVFLGFDVQLYFLFSQCFVPRGRGVFAGG